MALMLRRPDLPDPKSIVKSIPLPYSSHKDVKIQARTLDVYNAYLPLRDDVRKENYKRRMDQQNNMGFQTPIHVPYRVIGDPLYLEQADIILNGLGQFKQSIRETMKQIEAPIQKPKENKDTSKPIPSFSFRNLKESKQLMNLNKEVKRNEETLKKVRLGASLFQILREDEEKKKQFMESQREQMGSEMKIRPLIESDEELDGEDLSDDEELSLINAELNELNKDDAENNGNKTTRTVRINESVLDNEKSMHNSNDGRPQTYPVHRFNKMNSTAGTSVKRAKTTTSKIPKEHLKPYTPFYSSLIAPEETSTYKDEVPIKRQLCVLLWILESMSAEPPNYIGPLRTCFLINDLGGEKLSEKKFNKQKEHEEKWNRFRKLVIDKSKLKPSTGQTGQPSFNRVVKTRIMAMNRLKNGSFDKNDDSSIRSAEETTQNDSTSNINRMLKRISMATNQLKESAEESTYLDADESFTHSKITRKPPQIKIDYVTNDLASSLENTLIMDQSAQEATAQHNPLVQSQDSHNNTISNFDFCLPKNMLTVHSQASLESNRQQLTNTQSVTDTKSSAKDSREAKLRPRIPKPDRPRHKREKDFVVQLTKHELELLKMGDSADLERIFNRGSSKQERKNSISLKALTGPIHAVWTQNVLDYQSSLPSNKKRQELEELRNQFENVTDEKIIDIHKKLEFFFKKRIQNCMVKYQAMDPNERGLHKMLDAMKDNVIAFQRFEDKKNAAAQKVYYEWFLDVENIVASNYNKEDIIFSKLLEKLSFHGKLTTRKKNEALFFKVLDTLKIWELLSPDIMAAVEFARDKILEINEDDFEEWFRAKTHKHPQLFVSRKKEETDIEMRLKDINQKKIAF